MTVPTDTPDRLAGSPPAAGCPFSSSVPVFLFAFFLSPKQHWHAFQRWRDTFFVPLLAERAERLFRFRNCVTAHSRTHARTFLTFTRRKPTRQGRMHHHSPHTPFAHLSTRPGTRSDTVSFFLPLVPFYYCAASTIFFISSSDCNCDRFSCAPSLHRSRRPTSFSFGRRVLLAAVVA